jgi:hypothetical protein
MHGQSIERVRAKFERVATYVKRAALAADPTLCAAILGLCCLIVLAVITRHDAGVTLDESSQMRYGRRIAAWFSSGFRDRRAIVGDTVLARYGGLFDAIAELAVRLTPRDAVGTRHAASALCAIAGIVATWLCATRLAGRLAGLMAAAILTTTPLWVGHGLFNPKDIPFAAAAMFSVYGCSCIILAEGTPAWRTSIGTGLAVGAALGVRPGGMFLLSYPVLALLTRALCDRRDLWRAVASGMARSGACLSMAWMCMVSTWPWALEAPWTRPFQAACRASHWQGQVLFRGSFVGASHLPRSYLPVWFAITLPETYFLAAACGLALCWRALRTPPRLDRRLAAFGGVALAAFAPVCAFAIARPIVYDAQRHFLFVLPPLAVLAGVAITRFVCDSRFALQARSLVIGMLLALFGIIVVEGLRLHPYEYVYFNRLVGGLSGAQARYETEYWGASQYEALRWLSGQLRDDDDSKVRVGSCNHDEGVRLFLREHPEAAHRIVLAPRGAESDILLATTRNNCHKTPGLVLHVVERMGVPFLYVIQRHAIASNGRSRSRNHGS